MIMTKRELKFWDELSHYEWEIDLDMKEQGFTKEKMTTKEISDALGLFEEVTKEFIDYISQSTSKEKRE